MSRRASIASVLGCGIVALCTNASAQYAGNELGSVRHKQFTSPQHFALEFRFGPYKPSIDSEPGVSGSPYQSVFGNSYRVLAAVEFDWQALRIPHFGSIGPGVSFGYTSMGAKANFSTCPPSGSCQSAETTSLDVFPLYAVGVLRLDVLMKDFNIPLVPYGKAGAGLAFWRASNDAGTSSYGGVAGKGHTWGTQFAAGLALSLNWLDPRAARSLDSAVGINNTSLFGEIMWANLNGFGGTGSLHVGTTTFIGGLSLEF